MAVRWTPSGMQSYDPAQEFFDKLKDAKDKSSAAAAPATADVTTQTTETETESTDSAPPKVPTIIRDQDTGEITGVKLPNGESYVGISEEDVRMLVDKYTGAPTPVGAVEAGDLTKLKQFEGALGDVPIPRGEDITGQTANVFTELLAGQADNLIGSSDRGRIPGISGLLIEGNLGQAFAGISFLDNLESNEALQAQVLGLTDYMNDLGLQPEQVSNDPYTQAFLRMKLNENDLKMIKEGKADVSALAASLEAIPILSIWRRSLPPTRP